MAKNDVSGKDVVLRANGIVVGCATDITVNYTTDSQEATGCRDTNLQGKFKSFKPGQNSWKAELGNAQRRFITGADKSTQMSFTNFKEIWRNQTYLDLEWGTGYQGDELQKGRGFITSMTETNPMDGQATWSISIQGDGDITPEINEDVDPAAPTGGVVNDTNNTFDFTYVPGYTVITQYEYSVNNGSTYTKATVKPILVGNIAVAIGDLHVRVAETLYNNAGATLENASAFTTS